MLNARINRAHRHTRPSEYMDMSRQGRQQRASRPGASGFSFTGEFPEMADFSPVEAPSRRRQYTAASADTGAYRALGNTDAVRTPVITRYGVQLHTAALAFFVALIILGGFWLMAVSETTAVAKHIGSQQMRIEELTVANLDAEREIEARADDVAIRQEAVRLGLVSSKGAKVVYLTAPETAVITPATVVGLNNASLVAGN